jgi:hypothetical protein
MIVTAYSKSKVSPALLSKAEHALGLEQTVPHNDTVYSLNLWEEVVEAVGAEMNCPAQVIARAKSRYTYYMLYHYAPGV